MPYLGPRAFQTAPLTTNNLAYLNDRLVESQRQENASNRPGASRGAPGFAKSDRQLRHDGGAPLGGAVDCLVSDSNRTTLLGGRSATLSPQDSLSGQPASIAAASDSGRSAASANGTVSGSGASAHIVTGAMTASATSSSQADTFSFSTNSYDSSPKDTVSTPLSSISSGSSSSLADLSVHDVPTTPAYTVVSPVDARTIIADDDKTVISGSHADCADRGSADCQAVRHNEAPGSPVSAASCEDPMLLEAKPPLLRKKSGELVKSSLKLPSLQRSHSMPNTNKNVRFASRLEDVKFFRKSEKPTAVSNNSSPVQGPLINHQTVWDWDSMSSDDDDDDDSGDFDRDSVDDEHWETLSNDCPPLPSSLNFSRLSSGREVILESVKLNSLKTSLIGFVYVKNIAYEKKIVIRLTTDSWKSYVEIDNANYISSNNIFKYNDSNDESRYDKFSFIIKLNSLCSYNRLLDIRFCVEYIVGDKTYWDSNNGRNYHVVLNKTSGSSSSSSSSSSRHSRSPRSSTAGAGFNEYDDEYSTSHLLYQQATVSHVPRLDLDDVAFRLKKNSNFNDSFNNTASHRFVFHPKNSRNYMMKKIRSESSLDSLNPQQSQGSQQLRTSGSPHHSGNNSSNNTNTRGRSMVSKTAAPSPKLKSEGFGSAEEYYDYSQIVKNFCFYGSGTMQPSPQLQQTSAIPATPSSTMVGKAGSPAELSTEMSSFCLG